MTEDLTPYIERSAATDLPALLRAKEEAKRRMKDDPSKPNVEAFRTVRDEVDKAATDRPAGEGRLFAKKPGALAYLQGRGFAIQKTKFYADCKAGLVPTNAQGQYEEAVLLAYAAKLPVAAKEEDGKLNSEARRRLSADADHKSEQALLAKMRREKLEGQLVARSEVARGLAARAQFFRAQIENFGPLLGARIIAAVGGDEARLPEFLALWEEATADWMDAWSEDREFVAGPAEDPLDDPAPDAA
ncbi:hypothetical protein DVDV_0093 [Desulfovibrio sp. DV]|uniref:hypothetical protein n=1 Tax=Desulfovibrio sp. DV TaxID=1844708 RepID=UPI00094BB157|nr:hypothetical protein [Desulfovibrio sp. DV]OLN31305.1 hypothetical protein DVDV_0093 [Desulfovibrio sp. DV]